MKLHNVTLCAIDSKHPELAKKAMDRCKVIQFADEILIDEGIHSRQDYSQFVIKELYKHIKTPFVLFVQWDGWIINKDSWNPNFLDYDYIGAVWPWHTEGKRVGNGGFSLRSRRLLELTASPEFVYQDLNEDDLICHLNRDFLESKGIRFAPEDIARTFSYERELSNIKTFGFHGEFHMDKYDLPLAT